MKRQNNRNNNNYCCCNNLSFWGISVDIASTHVLVSVYVTILVVDKIGQITFPYYRETFCVGSGSIRILCSHIVSTVTHFENFSVAAVLCGMSVWESLVGTLEGGVLW